MPEDISVQILSQTSDNIQKLFDLSTRIDERVKALQDKEAGFNQNIEEVKQHHEEAMRKIAVLESLNTEEKFSEAQHELVELDKRLALTENNNNKSQDRWNKILTFIIQLVWVILASYLLMKFNLTSPQVP